MHFGIKNVRCSKPGPASAGEAPVRVSCVSHLPLPTRAQGRSRKLRGKNNFELPVLSTCGTIGLMLNFARVCRVAGADPGGSCRGLQPLPNGNWRPWAECASVPLFIAFRLVSQPGVNFCTEGVICASFYQRMRPSDSKRRPFCRRRRPSNHIQHLPRRQRRPSGMKRPFSL